MLNKIVVTNHDIVARLFLGISGVDTDHVMNDDRIRLQQQRLQQDWNFRELNFLTAKNLLEIFVAFDELAIVNILLLLL